MTFPRLTRLLLSMASFLAGPSLAQPPQEVPTIATEMPRVLIPQREAEVTIPVGGQEIAVLRLAEDYGQRHGLEILKNYSYVGARPIGFVKIRVTATSMIALYLMGPRGKVFIEAQITSDDPAWVPHWDRLLQLIPDQLGQDVRIGPREHPIGRPSAGPNGK